MSEFWKIEENVGPGYIAWAGTFRTKDEAHKHVHKITRTATFPKNVRVAKYRTGTGSAGPVRVE